MANIEHNNDDEILCDCSGTRRSKIISLVQDRGIDTLDGISRITGAYSGCGSCEYDIQDLLDELAEQK